MGANQSDQQEDSNSRGQNQPSGGILVVNPTPGQKDAQDGITLPKRAPPVLSVERQAIDPNRHKPKVHQLDDQLWADLASILSQFSKSRAELIAERQNQLQEKIVQIDAYIQRFSDSYVNGKHKALTRMNEDCRKMDDIGKLLQKSTLQSELCLNMLNKLNFLLPEEQKLELLEP